MCRCNSTYLHEENLESFYRLQCSSPPKSPQVYSFNCYPRVTRPSIHLLNMLNQNPFSHHTPRGNSASLVQSKFVSYLPLTHNTSLFPNAKTSHTLLLHAAPQMFSHAPQKTNVLFSRSVTLLYLHYYKQS